MIVCSCFGVSDKDIKKLIDDGTETVEDIMLATYATMGCGCCKDQLTEIVNEYIEQDGYKTAIHLPSKEKDKI